MRFNNSAININYGDMNNEKQSLFRIPLLLSLISLSYSLVVFSWGMTEHENMWALGMYIGAASFGIFVAFYLYTFRLLGIKVMMRLLYLG